MHLMPPMHLMHEFRGLGSGLVVRAAHGAPFMHSPGEAA